MTGSEDSQASDSSGQGQGRRRRRRRDKEPKFPLPTWLKVCSAIVAWLTPLAIAQRYLTAAWVELAIAAAVVLPATWMALRLTRAANRPARRLGLFGLAPLAGALAWLVWTCGIYPQPWLDAGKGQLMVYGNPPRVLASDGKRVRVINVASGRVLHALDAPGRIVLPPRGPGARQLMVAIEDVGGGSGDGSEDGSTLGRRATVWYPNEGQLLHEMSLPDLLVGPPAVSRDGRHVAWPLSRHRLRIVDLEDPKQVVEVKGLLAPRYGLIFDFRSKRLMALTLSPPLPTAIHSWVRLEQRSTVRWDPQRPIINDRALGATPVIQAVDDHHLMLHWPRTPRLTRLTWRKGRATEGLLPQLATIERPDGSIGIVGIRDVKPIDGSLMRITLENGLLVLFDIDQRQLRGDPRPLGEGVRLAPGGTWTVSLSKYGQLELAEAASANVLERTWYISPPVRWAWLAWVVLATVLLRAWIAARPRQVRGGWWSMTAAISIALGMHFTVLLHSTGPKVELYELTAYMLGLTVIAISPVLIRSRRALSWTHLFSVLVTLGPAVGMSIWLLAAGEEMPWLHP